jgi:hypothetical protein
MWKAIALLLTCNALSTIGYMIVDSQCPSSMHGPDTNLQSTVRELGALETAAAAFRDEHGRHPRSFEELASVGRIHADRRDWYGNPYVLRPDGGRLLYSIGRNGIDEAGAGDDIVTSGKTYSCPLFYACPTVCDRVNGALLVGTALAWLSTILLLGMSLVRRLFKHVASPRD